MRNDTQKAIEVTVTLEPGATLVVEPSPDIEKLEISVRTYNALQNMGITTVHELRQRFEDLDLPLKVRKEVEQLLLPG